MATKKEKVWHLVLDEEMCCSVNANETTQSVEFDMFENEKAATNVASVFLQNQNKNETDMLMVYKLVLVARVKRSKTVVEKV
jgi:hypothetical protein